MKSNDQLLNTIYSHTTYNENNIYGLIARHLTEQDLYRVISNIYQNTEERVFQINLKSSLNNLISTMQINITDEYLDIHYKEEDNPPSWEITNHKIYPVYTGQ